LFLDFNADGELLHEAGCILRRSEGLHGMAVDTVTCALPIQALTSGQRIQTDVLIFGGGGAGRALAVHLRRHHSPSRLVVTDVSPQRLREAAAIVSVESAPAEANDSLIGSLSPGALIINATGLGKDLPGSPISERARFPVNAIAWDLNYRGDLMFLNYARAQDVRCEDGWVYFISGWLHIMAGVFDVTLTPNHLERAIAETRR
jgi:shikimate 5-dehydrogenase